MACSPIWVLEFLTEAVVIENFDVHAVMLSNHNCVFGNRRAISGLVTLSVRGCCGVRVRDRRLTVFRLSALNAGVSLSQV